MSPSAAPTSPLLPSTSATRRPSRQIPCPALLSLSFLLPSAFLLLERQRFTTAHTATVAPPRFSPAALVTSAAALHAPLELPTAPAPAPAPREPPPRPAPAPARAPVGRVAICITGHARSFHRPAVHESILRNLVTPIRRSAAAVDLFFHLGLDDVPRDSTQRAERMDREVEEAVGEMQPVSVSHFGNENVPLNRSRAAACRAPRSYASGVYPASLLRANECYQKMQAYEKLNSFRYEWFVKSRPDVAFGDPVAHMSTLKADRVYINEHIPGTSTPTFENVRELYPDGARKVLRKPLADHIAVVPRALADNFFSAHEAVSECLSDEQKKPWVNAESLMALWVAKNSIPYETKPWFWMLVRDGVGPECRRVQWIGRELNRTAELNERCQQFRQTGVLPVGAPRPCRRESDVASNVGVPIRGAPVACVE